MASVTPDASVGEVSQCHGGDKMCQPGYSHFLDTLHWVISCSSRMSPNGNALLCQASVSHRRSMKPRCTFLTRLASPTREDLRGGQRSLLLSVDLIAHFPTWKDFKKPHCFTPTTYSSIHFLGTGKGTFSFAVCHFLSFVTGEPFDCCGP